METKQNNNYKKYVDLLKANYNIVLTGAPGTGKTYMAQQIALALGCTADEVRFVQFHPSYDYTDFVEGLRPIDKGNGQIVFERKDGVFKEFCRAAVQNIVESQKSAEQRKKEQTWQYRLEAFTNDAIDNARNYKTVNGANFRIEAINNNTISIYNEKNIITSKVSVSIADVLDMLNNDVVLNNVQDIRKHFGRRNNTQADSYAFVITKEVRNTDTVTTADDAKVITQKPFVFIIDEINRGEASKIFGELFFAIDPGYRGQTSVKVKTQYQNLIEDSDAFANGFYIPRNVYIIGTMNDIDRSVESMDFAMRRRFTWIEVSPDDTVQMLTNKLEASVAAEAIDRMKRLNSLIAQTDGLGKAYQIGPAYFLKLEQFGADFNALWQMNIEPLLREYLRGFRKSEELLKSFAKAYNAKEPTDATDDQVENED